MDGLFCLLNYPHTLLVNIVQCTKHTHATTHIQTPSCNTDFHIDFQSQQRHGFANANCHFDKSDMFSLWHSRYDQSLLWRFTYFAIDLHIYIYSMGTKVHRQKGNCLKWAYMWLFDNQLPCPVHIHYSVLRTLSSYKYHAQNMVLECHLQAHLRGTCVNSMNYIRCTGNQGTWR